MSKRTKKKPRKRKRTKQPPFKRRELKLEELEAIVARTELGPVLATLQI